jgi:deoxyribonuclease V
MTKPFLHPWTLDPDEATQLQGGICKRLLLVWEDRTVDTIGGVDIKYSGDIATVAIAVLTYPDMVILASVTSHVQLVFPYISGLLVFRVGPAILATWEKLKIIPDLILMHGHGTAHPRGVGLASHLGLWLDLPTIGVAKTRLYGFSSDPAPQAGGLSELLDERDTTQVIGAVLRTRLNTKPVFVSPGHQIDLNHSVEFVLTSCRGFRFPEPIRAAHKQASDAILPV